MSSFDDEDVRAKYAVLPKSSTKQQIVAVEQKTVATKAAVRRVLPEEKYYDNLEKIITKDYFPELEKLKAQKEYIDAVARNDIAKIHELRLRYKTSRRTDLRTGSALSRASTMADNQRSQSPDVFDPETPGISRPSTSRDDPYDTNLPYSNAEGDNEIVKPKKKKKELSVTSYLNKYTSEDNASFEELTKVMRDREEAKRQWVHDAAKKHNEELVSRSIMAKDADVQLALKLVPNADDARPNHLDNWTFTKWNSALFNPPGAELTAEEVLEAKRKSQTVINKSATRFADDPKKKASEEAMVRAARFQAELNQGKVDALGNEINPANDFALLKTPSPAPGVDASPFMTWGEIDGTPFQLDASDMSPAIDNAPTFKMPEVPYRDQIAQGINDSIAAKYRDKRKVAMKAAERAHHTPGFGSSRLSLLSPAAQRLATSKLGIRVGSSKSRSTHSPAVSRKLTTPGSSKSSRTPIEGMIRKRTTTPKTPKMVSLTDGLLDGHMTSYSDVTESKEETAKKRPRAGDFF